MTFSIFSSARRHNTRRKVSIDVMLWSQESRVQGTIIDLAECGCRLSCEDKLAATKEMHLRFELPYTAATIRCDGRVIWASDEKASAGIEFLRISEPDRRRIAHWLANNAASGEIVN